MPECECSNAWPPFIRSSFGESSVTWRLFSIDPLLQGPQLKILPIPPPCRSKSEDQQHGHGAARPCLHATRDKVQSFQRLETRHIHPSISTPAQLHHDCVDQHLITAQITKRVRGNKPSRRLTVKTDPLNSSSLYCTSRFNFFSLSFFAEWCCS